MKITRRPLQVIRLLYINYVLLRNRVDILVFSTEILQPFRFLSYFNPWNWFPHPKKRRGEVMRQALEQLGPIFVKFGQILSTRRDLLPDDIADELAKLQDNVPPFPGSIAKEILEKEFGKPLHEIFTTFDLTPLASASIAQVHAATLRNGNEVVVKIVRPHIEKIIVRDISLLYSAASITEKFFPHGKRLRAREIVSELERSIHYELDLQHEGANASLLRRNFLNSQLLYVPEVCWEYSSTHILVMERIGGIPISDIATLQRHGINLRRLAEKGVEIFFTQVFRDNFFHADMHPGNIFVSKDNPFDPHYIAVDFGIMGTLNPQDQRYLAENFLAFFRRDYYRVAQLHIESGWVASNTRVNEFETAIRGVLEPIFQRPLKDISLGKLLIKLFQTARQFNMEVQPQFILLQKTLLNIEGLGRQLYPELDLWSSAKPYLEKWVKEQLGPKALIKKITQHAPYWVDKLVDLPDLVHATLTQQRQLMTGQLAKKSSKEKYTSSGKFLTGMGIGLFSMVIVNYFLFDFKNIAFEEINTTFGIVALVFLILGRLQK